MNPASRRPAPGPAPFHTHRSAGPLQGGPDQGSPRARVPSATPRGPHAKLNRELPAGSEARVAQSFPARRHGCPAASHLRSHSRGAGPRRASSSRFRIGLASHPTRPGSTGRGSLHKNDLPGPRLGLLLPPRSGTEQDPSLSAQRHPAPPSGGLGLSGQRWPRERAGRCWAVGWGRWWTDHAPPVGSSPLH